MIHGILARYEYLPMDSLAFFCGVVMDGGGK